MNKKEGSQKENSSEEKLKTEEKGFSKEKKFKKEELENKLKKENKLEKELEDLKRDKLLLLAELDNKQKEFHRQIGEIYKYSNKKFVCAVLDFLVDLEEKALKAMRADPEGKVKEHLQGIGMLRDNLWKILESEGVKEIEVKKGVDLWNSYFHELGGSVEDEELPEGTIKDVVRKGYLLHGQLLLPVKVKISIKKDK